MAVSPIRLADLAAGTGGFVLYGRDSGDALGNAVASAGDINGDGFDDIIIGAFRAWSSGNASVIAGEAYVVFGSAAGFGASVDLGQVAAGIGGFVLPGRDSYDQAGTSVASAGDINGDGLADLIVGAGDARGLNNATPGAGEAYVVFGRTTGFGATVSLSAIAAGTGGFILHGIDASDAAGRPVASAGDINGDGFDDIIIGAPLADSADNARSYAGESYVVFGKAGGFGSSLSLASVAAGTGGFVILGRQAGDHSGGAVASGGDVNGDGFDDLIVGAYRANDPSSGTARVGVTTVIFGKATGFGPSIDLSSFGDGFDGFTIVGRSAFAGAGFSVGSAGDFNGDGFADIVIGAPSANESFVVFGKQYGFGARIDLAVVAAGTGGFILRGIDAYDLAGISVSSAGDVNGDGLDDLVIGARHADGELNTAPYSGDSYVVFGRTAGFGAGINLSDIAAGTGGFGIFNQDAYDFAGNAVSAAGDINGDGFDDLIIGVANGEGAGNTKPAAGEAYVLFGRDFTGTVTHAGNAAANTLTGTIGANIMVGGQGADTLIGRGGADTLIGGSGDDIIRVSNLSFQRVDGGGGTDTLALDGDRNFLTLYAISDLRIQGIERIDLTGTGDNFLTLTYREVLNLSGTSNALRVDGNAGDNVFMSRERWIVGDTVGGYTTYTQGQATVSIATAINVTGLLGVPSIHLSDVAAGTGGFVILGAQDYDQSGVSVRSAGDIDGDGFDDIIIGAHFVNVIDTIDHTELVTAGAGYVIYGKAGGFGAPLDLGAIATGHREHGFVIDGMDPGDFTGWSVASAGDVNGDGFDDMLLGAPNGDAEDNTRPGAGDSYIVFGTADRYSLGERIDLSDISFGLHNVDKPLRGVVLHGAIAGEGTGFAVASAGDINGDGFDDIVIGAPSADPGGKTDAGTTYVLFGKASWQEPRLDLAQIGAGTGGFTIRGRDARDGSGYSVASAGDINGDGLDDLLIGAPYGDGRANGKPETGETYVVFGRTTGFGATIELSQVAAGTGGFVINGQGANVISGDQSGVSVAGAGDFNGDGFADLVIGARFGDGPTLNRYEVGLTYLVLGKATGFGANVDLATVAAGTGGLVIRGRRSFDRSGYSVASAGDINGDGFDDLIIGAPGGIGNGGYGSYSGYAGDTYIVFGRAAGAGAPIDLSEIAYGMGGFVIRGDGGFDASGSSVASAGDVNGDGFDDLVIGARNASPQNGSLQYAGETYVLFGRDFTKTVTKAGSEAAETLVGTSVADIMVGGMGDDRLVGNGGADVLIGGAGNDVLSIGSMTFRRVMGGSGIDTLELNGAGATLDLTTIADNRIQGIERINLGFSLGGTLRMTARDVLNLSDTSNTLRVDGNPGNAIRVTTDNWLRVGSALGYTTYVSGQATLEVRNAVTWLQSAIDLGTIPTGGGTTGFVITGREAYDQAGSSVASAGDVNGDGFDDIIIGARYADGPTNNRFDGGESYVVFGKQGGFGSTISLNTIAAGTGGFVLYGAAAGDRAGQSVASAGDINGDGFDDLAIGAKYATTSGHLAGQTHVVFGKADGFGAGIDLASVGAAGFVILGEQPGDRSGYAVASAGDINGDGFDDLLIGTPFTAVEAMAGAGKTYVVFGKASGFGASLALSSIANGTGAAGFVVNGAAFYDWAGFSVASAGDVNGDGFDDLAIGARASSPAGKTFVVFGKEGGFAPQLDLGTIQSGAAGFVILGVDPGDEAGFSVASAGDVNGDGYADILIGARSGDGTGNLTSSAGDSYVVFGKAGGFGGTVDLTDIAAGTGGFVIRGIDAGDESGISVASAGDINGDGFDDILIGARYGDRADNTVGSAGETYVIFGKAAPFVGGVSLASIAAGIDGFVVYGQFGGDVSGMSVASAGDIDGDGFDDVVIGARYADIGGHYAGQSYVLFGRNFTNSVTHLGTAGNDTMTGTSGDDVMVGGFNSDILNGKGGADVLLGGGENDTILVSDLTFQRIDGGGGDDALVLTGAGLTLDLTAIPDSRLRGIERIDLTGSGNNALKLSAREVLRLSDSTNTLRVDGNTGDTIALTAEAWLRGATDGGYTTYTNGQATLEVASAITWILPAVYLADTDERVSVIYGRDRDDKSARSVASAGDINGDGFEDLIIGAPYASAQNNENQNAGEAYVVYGRAGGLDAEPDLAAIAAGTGGFILFGPNGRFSTFEGSRTGFAVASAGDFNGDGLLDLAVGQDSSNNSTSPIKGSAYVVYGRASGMPADGVALAGLNGGTSNLGFVIRSPNTGDLVGTSIASAGDINGDGLDDLILGASRGGGSLAGQAYVVFGRGGLSGASVDLAAVAGGTGGFIIVGADGADRFGFAVSSAGDVNGDGLDDLVVGAPYGGQVNSPGLTYVIFGRTTGFGASVNLATVTDGTGGFVIQGRPGSVLSGSSVAAAGDINGDGFADIIVGGPSGDGPGNNRYSVGESYVVFGSAGGFPGTIDMAAVAAGTGAGGFVIFGNDLGDQSGAWVAGAGDLNGDGYDDLLIGAPTGDGTGNAGNPDFKENSGETYVVFGRPEPFGATIDLAAIAAGSGGFVVHGRDRFDLLGDSIGVGDIDGDGFDDLILGAWQAYGPDNTRRTAGETTIIHGRNFTNAVTGIGGAGIDTLTGTIAPDVFVGGAGADVLIGNGGADVLLGGAGADVIRVFDLTFRRVDGGGGMDTLALAGKNITLDLTTMADSRLRGIERIDLTGSGNNTVFLTPLEVLNLSETGNALRIDGNAGDSVILPATSWIKGATAGGYTAYSKGQAKLQVSTALTLRAVTPTALDLVIASDTGTSNRDDITRDNTPTVTGSGEAFATVTLYNGATALGSAKANGGGAWSITSKALAAGTRIITAKAVGTTGAVSLLSDGLAVTIDLTAPAAPGLPNLADESDSGASVTDNITRVTAPTFLGKTEANATVTLFKGATTIGTGKAAEDGTWSIKSAVLANGTHAITAKVTDVAGNVGAASAALTVKVDTLAPAAPSAPNMTATTDSGRSGADNLTQVTTPAFSGTAEALATITLLDGATVVGTGKANAVGSWLVTVDALAEGTHAIRARATDQAGNTSGLSAALQVRIDTTSVAPPVVLKVATTQIAGSAVGASTVTVLDGATTLGVAVVKPSGAWTLGVVLTAGTHAISGRAADLAGNTSVASAPVKVVVGTAAADSLTLGADSGFMVGAAGNDTYHVGNGAAVVTEVGAGGADTVIASVGYTLPDASAIEFLHAAAGASGLPGGLALTGNKLANTIVGGSGADILAGGRGLDVLTGGAGPDVFLFREIADSSFGGSARDRITDFSIPGGDRIDLRPIDANVGTPGDQAFTFIGSAAFSGSAGELNQSVLGTNTWVQGDATGDGVGDFSFLLNGSHTLSAAHFNL